MTYSQADINNMREQVSDNLAGLFAMVDINGDGFIEKDELRYALDRGFECFPPGLYEGSETWD